jgi:hypothetical protein
VFKIIAHLNIDILRVDIDALRKFCIFFYNIKDGFILNNSVRTSQETHYFSATQTNRLMLFRERVAVYCEKNTERPDTLCA